MKLKIEGLKVKILIFFMLIETMRTQNKYLYSEVITKALDNGIEINSDLVKKREDLENQKEKIKSSLEKVQKVTAKNQSILDKIDEKIS